MAASGVALCAQFVGNITAKTQEHDTHVVLILWREADVDPVFLLWADDQSTFLCLSDY